MEFIFEVSYTNTEAINAVDSELKSIEDIKINTFEQDGFDGLHILIYFIVAGGIKSIAKVIIKIISRSDVKSFKYEGIECKGYSEKEVEKLLDKVSKLSASNLKMKQK